MHYEGSIAIDRDRLDASGMRKAGGPSRRVSYSYRSASIGFIIEARRAG
jgi:hypothetical protein